MAEGAAFTTKHVQKHRWIRLREFGWLLVAAWQVVALVSEFVYIADLDSKPVRIAGKLLGLVGLALVAYGFERLMRIEHTHAMDLKPGPLGSLKHPRRRDAG